MYLTGPDAEQAADWLFTTHLSQEPGKVSYTLSLNSKGGIESDVTITTLEEGGGTLVGPILKVIILLKMTPGINIVNTKNNISN